MQGPPHATGRAFDTWHGPPTGMLGSYTLLLEASRKRTTVAAAWLGSRLLEVEVGTAGDEGVTWPARFRGGAAVQFASSGRVKCPWLDLFRGASA